MNPVGVPVDSTWKVDGQRELAGDWVLLHSLSYPRERWFLSHEGSVATPFLMIPLLPKTSTQTDTTPKKKKTKPGQTLREPIPSGQRRYAKCPLNTSPHIAVVRSKNALTHPTGSSNYCANWTGALTGRKLTRSKTTLRRRTPLGSTTPR